MTNRYPGPSMELSQEIDAIKYRQEGEDFHGKIDRIATSLKDNEEHYNALMDIMGNMRFLAAGRVQSAQGANKIATSYNCFVSGKIEDSMNSIMEKAHEAAETMRRGGGIGYDFSAIRPRGDLIKSLNSNSSGPVSFMQIYDAVCQTISSSGHRRGAQMGVLRVDHPDIQDFVRAKRNSDKLTGFNVSVGITDAFMEAIDGRSSCSTCSNSCHKRFGAGCYCFDLVFEGTTYDTINAYELWEEIMSSTWDWAEPGVLFIDQINRQNNLWYCEEIAATNPCGEQPLPAYGACLLGSFNLTKYVTLGNNSPMSFDYTQFKKDIPHVVRAIDNVIDRTIYPLKQQEDEAKNKRRMGLGLTGLANAGETLGHEYGSPEFIEWAEGVFKLLRNGCYRASADLAEEKGAFPLYDDKLLQSGFAKTLPYKLRRRIKQYGLRNSHLTSIAPTGTISLVADNVSGGIEPVFSHYYDRTIQTFEGPRIERVEDYAFSYGVKGRTAGSLSTNEHLAVLALAQHYVDSACSKTINVGDDVSYDDFKEIYKKAWNEGCKGCTTFRASGKRYGILNETLEEKKEDTSQTQSTPEESGEKAEACFIDLITGQRECS